MKYNLIKDVIDLLADFEKSNIGEIYSNDINGFKQWVSNSNHILSDSEINNVEWEGKEGGRSPESVISTMLVHMNRYAKSYSRAAILNSEFSTQDDFIFLITLKVFGEMSKMDLIKRNVHDKPGGMLIINRLLAKGWVVQKESSIDKRSKILAITTLGLLVLDSQMSEIRKATTIVAGNLSTYEKVELIRLLKKLNAFHLDIYEKHFDVEHLLDEALLLKN